MVAGRHYLGPKTVASIAMLNLRTFTRPKPHDCEYGNPGSKALAGAAWFPGDVLYDSLGGEIQTRCGAILKIVIVASAV